MNSEILFEILTLKNIRIYYQILNNFKSIKSSIQSNCSIFISYKEEILIILFGILLQKISKNVTIIQWYLPIDFTIYMKHEYKKD